MKMNRANFQRLIDKYIEKYEMLNNEENHEIYKWTAVNHFQKYWDLNADRFGEMFKKATEKTFNIINNATVQPSNGIVFLCKQDRLIEKAVQEEFKKLLAPDEGDIRKRQVKIEIFNEAINNMLEKYAHGKWKYRQDMRSTIMHLSFIAPDDNFMYKSTAAKEFAECYEFGDDFGGGKSFRLDIYYRMCRELVEEIKKNQVLCDILEKRLEYEEGKSGEKDNPVTEVAGRYNILAYDIMFCANYYELYSDIPVKKRTKAGKEEQNKQEIEEKMNMLLEKRNNMKQKLAQIDVQLKEKTFPYLLGEVITNVRYGEGKVTEQKEKYITVEFAVGTKSFLLPDAFSKGFLTSEKPHIMSEFKALALLMEEQTKYFKEIKLLDKEISIFESK